MAESFKPVILISYSDKDESTGGSSLQNPGWLTFLLRYFQPALTLAEIDLLSDRPSTFGSLRQKLHRCDIFILLLSANNYDTVAVNQQLEIIRDRLSHKEDVHFYAVFLSGPTNVRQLDFINNKNVRPRSDKTFSDMLPDDRGSQMSDLAAEIAQLAAGIRQRGGSRDAISAQELLSEISDYCRKNGLAESTFGRRAVNDGKLASRLRHGGRISAETVGRIRSFMANNSSLPIVEIVGLSEALPGQFSGREKELEILDNAWAGGNTRVVSVIGGAGSGKTALIAEWLRKMHADNYRHAEIVLGWSFFASKVVRKVALEEGFEDFLAWARRSLGSRAAIVGKLSKGESLAELMRNRKVLLILDDIELDQDSRGARPKDSELDALLRKFTAVSARGSHGLIVLTSQFPIDSVTRWQNRTTEVIALDSKSVAGITTAGAASLTPPPEPLPGPSPATHFAYVDGQFDVVLPTAWANRGEQVTSYHTRARHLATALAERLRNTNAVPDLGGSVTALLDVLSDDISKVQPDQLRLASRSIAARARAFGHHQAQWEISVDAVANLFELADALVDLQAFVRTDIEAHESAVRRLEFTRESAAEAKTALDLLTEIVVSSPELISVGVETAFETAATVSASALDEQVKIGIEGDRTLLSTNLALAVARELGTTSSKMDDSKLPRASQVEPVSLPVEQGKSKGQRRRGPTDDENSWTEFGERVMARIHKKGPEAIGDATIQAASSVIKHAPKTVSGLAAAFVLLATSNPIIAGGTVAVTLAWLAYEIRRRQK